MTTKSAAGVGVALIVLLSASLVASPRPRAAAVDALPTKLSGAEFWKLVTDLSEDNGYFRSDNLVSNEHTFQYVVPALKKAARPGGVYLGVAPDQNFTYMLAVDPRMAFIVDIRRGNLHTLMMYKALIEMSADRADFVSRLFTKKRPAGLTASSSALDLFTAYDLVQTDVSNDGAAYKANVKAMDDWLVTHDGLPLPKDDLDGIAAVYSQFYWYGPAITYSSSSSSQGVQMGTSYPNYQDLMCANDGQGHARSYLASEDNFTQLKSLEERNLIVPIVGNFAGPKALKAVGSYIRAHGATVAAFYVSNVEQYLFPTNLGGSSGSDWQLFYNNVATLPVDDASTFIRSVSQRNGFTGTMLGPDGRGSGLDPMAAFIKDYQAGRIQTYWDVNTRSR
jgi:hypothetical protein